MYFVKNSNSKKADGKKPPSSYPRLPSSSAEAPFVPAPSRNIFIGILCMYLLKVNEIIVMHTVLFLPFFLNNFENFLLYNFGSCNYKLDLFIFACRLGSMVIHSSVIS